MAELANDPVRIPPAQSPPTGASGASASDESASASATNNTAAAPPDVPPSTSGSSATLGALPSSSLAPVEDIPSTTTASPPPTLTAPRRLAAAFLSTPEKEEPPERNITESNTESEIPPIAHAASTPPGLHSQRSAQQPILAIEPAVSSSSAPEAREPLFASSTPSTAILVPEKILISAPAEITPASSTSIPSSTAPDPASEAVPTTLSSLSASTAAAPGSGPNPIENGGPPALANMSNAQQQGGLRQSMGYGSQGTYSPSNTLPSTASYHYQQPMPSSNSLQPSADPYRNPPTVGPNNQNILPSVHTLEGMHPRPHQPPSNPSHMHVMAPSVPSNVQPSMPFYGQGGLSFRDMGLGGQFLPPALMGVTRPKKMLFVGDQAPNKNRLFDMSQTTDKGYDPIFKQQQQQQQPPPGPAAIQPATNPKGPLPSAPTTLSSSTPVSYGARPSLLSGSGSVDSPSSIPPPVKTEYSPTSSLVGGLHGSTPVTRPSGAQDTHHAQSLRHPQSQLQGLYSGQSQLKGGNITFHPSHSLLPLPRSDTDSNREAKMEPGTHPPQPVQGQARRQQRPQPHTHPTRTTDTVSLYSMVERLKSSSICPMPSDPNKIIEVADQFAQFYDDLYCPALCSFFETRWFEVHKPNLHHNPPLLHLAAAFMETLTPQYPHPDHPAYLETQVVWALACQVLVTPDSANEGPALPLDTDAIELRNRVCVFDTLMSGTYLSKNPLIAPSPGQGDHQRGRQFEFWHLVCSLLEFAPSASQMAQQADILDQMRKLLDGRENRDVLYSIAVLRIMGDWYRNSDVKQEEYKNENDPSHRWAVASQFIASESQTTGGTTAVVRRFSEIARTAFVTDGWNCEPR
ncbi:uncharacterized protein MKZ38_001140 [Zalerion maritima]|uniref:Uncharacterized protein n=1 Tax=Zalerion maritima TaxID=339359 RepID=A0AAD5RQQ0_9PEZI|nr:uncharacterized protein MKZ38_001140 [Zalerion maritima]